MSKYILITGGELFNKGAQSMTFITVDELSRRFPDKEIVLLSNADYERNRKDKEQYLFKIFPLNIGMIFELLGGIYKLAWRLKAKSHSKKKYEAFVPKFKKILENTDFIIDISGYALSSQWGFISSLGYLSRLIIAKKYSIKVYIMPQSFGPFSYRSMLKPIINYLIKKYMKYPEVIYTREMEGYNFLHNNYKLNNVKKSYDLVLLNKGIDISNIYKSVPKIPDFEAMKGIGIIPNMRNFDHGNIENIMVVYDIIINKLMEKDKTVYLIRHSYEDIQACKMIKERFKNNDKVSLVVDDMNCIQFDRLVKNFDFIIASRFHSIVHAYKNNVPCIAIGWATKYHELLQTFKQEKYIFDVRHNIDITGIKKSLNTMLERYQKESETIKFLLKEIQSDSNIFDIIGGKQL
jgi:colanic acid/amylovoran biosynthesis protein